jgi:HPt (histidine-containing phosphotransfer) domain-containing protein
MGLATLWKPEDLLRMTGEDTELAAELIELFCRDASTAVAPLWAGSDVIATLWLQNRPGLRAAMHRLRGSLLQMGAPEPAALAAELERSALEGTESDVLARLACLALQIDAVRAAMQAWASSCETETHRRTQT